MLWVLSPHIGLCSVQQCAKVCWNPDVNRTSDVANFAVCCSVLQSWCESPQSISLCNIATASMQPARLIQGLGCSVKMLAAVEMHQLMHPHSVKVISTEKYWMRRHCSWFQHRVTARVSLAWVDELSRALDMVRLCRPKWRCSCCEATMWILATVWAKQILWRKIKSLIKLWFIPRPARSGLD